MKKDLGKIDLTPTWKAVLPIYIDALKGDNLENQKLVEQELLRMAKAADLWNASQKK